VFLWLILFQSTLVCVFIIAAFYPIFATFTLRFIDFVILRCVVCVWQHCSSSISCLHDWGFYGRWSVCHRTKLVWIITLNKEWCFCHLFIFLPSVLKHWMICFWLKHVVFKRVTNESGGNFTCLCWCINFDLSHKFLFLFRCMATAI
jgi:hypothetical protein